MVNLNPRSTAAANVTVSTSSTLHPDYQYWAPIWAKIRDAEIGEVEVKNKGQKYLPKLAGHDREQYNSFLQRAVFYNMTAKTLNALYGSLFKRSPKVTGYKVNRRLFKDGSPLNLVAKVAAKEVLALGRWGALLDAPAEGGAPFIASYTAENILDWELADIAGEYRLSRVVLREVEADRSSPNRSAYQFKSRFRVLALVPSPTGWAYEVRIYDDVNGSGVPDFRFEPAEVYTPTVRGRTVDYIPFQFFGPFHNGADCAKPPILDIVTLNYSHYQSYAHLEQGRFYTANPVYAVSGGTGDGEAGEYFVGPDVVWELGQNGKAEILEFQGRGLRSLESALDQKEAQIASIGGRMLSPSTGPGVSDGALKLREQDEQSLLANLAGCLDDGFTRLVRWHADWSNVRRADIEKITFEVARDFATNTPRARELRAIHQMFAGGVLPVSALYEYLRKADVVPDWLAEEEFTALLNDPAQFPNMPEVIAKMAGFPDAETWRAHHEKERAA